MYGYTTTAKISEKGSFAVDIFIAKKAAPPRRFVRFGGVRFYSLGENYSSTNLISLSLTNFSASLPFLPYIVPLFFILYPKAFSEITSTLGAMCISISLLVEITSSSILRTPSPNTTLERESHPRK